MYCAHCGEPTAEASHEGCLRALDMEPPRYCTECRRRMVVQVVPKGWTARCAEHGVHASASSTSA